MPVEKVKNYTTVIKKPMCFLWMKDKVEKGFYLEHPDEFQNDFTKIGSNLKFAKYKRSILIIYLY